MNHITGEIPMGHFNRNMAYVDARVNFARNKQHTIEDWMRSDERKDQAIAAYRRV